MRRMVKEGLLTFDATPLFPERIAYTVPYKLSGAEAQLYKAVTDYVRDEFNRRERLESRLRELELLQRGAEVAPILAAAVPTLDAEDVEDLEDAPDNEIEAAEEEILDQATAARTIAELKAEIEALKRLELLALTVRRSGADTKWWELASLPRAIFTPAAIANRVAEQPAPYGSGALPPPTASPRQKLVLFTEHRVATLVVNSRSRTATCATRKSASV